MAQDHHVTSEISFPPAVSIRVRDGLRLAVRRYDARTGQMAPKVVCLPGLTRNSRDFHTIATALAGDPDRPRTVYAIDARGRGLSDTDPDWKNYSVPIETQDLVDIYAALGVHGAAVIGTSRGGLQAMVLGAFQPTALGPVILNDIGPVIEREGLARIAGYVGKGAVPVSWSEAATLVQGASREHFPSIPAATWAIVARQLYNETDGRPARGYDPAIGRGFSILGAPPPTLWPQFGTLARVPLLIIRGERSDLLSAETVRQMESRHPRARSYVVPGQGHAPLLMDEPTISHIKQFLAASDATH